MTEPRAAYKARRGASKPVGLPEDHGDAQTPQKPIQRKSRAFRLKAQVSTETQVLNAVLRYLHVERQVAWAARMNSGAAKIPTSGGKERFLRFGFPGCPDVLGQMTDGRLIAIECKRPGGRRRPEQIAFIEMALRYGALAMFAESVDQVREAIRDCGRSV